MKLALPIVGGMVSQNILNLVDTFMVSRLGDPALAGVGMASFANFMSIAFITGLSAGVQAMAARRLGEERHSETAIGLNGGLLLALALGAPLTLVLFVFAPVIFPLLVEQPDIIEQGVPYWQMRLIGVVAVGVNFSFRGYWNGVNQTWRYFVTLVVMHIANIAISAVLIFGLLGFPEMGTQGAGLGSAIATWLGTFIYFAHALSAARDNGFLRGLPGGDTLKTMLRLAVPAGLQQLSFAAGMSVFFAIIGRVGKAELAASTVLVNLLLLAILPSMAFGLASASLVGQALGRKNPADAKRWGWEVTRIATALIVVMVLPALFVPDVLLAGFLEDPTTLALARDALLVIALGLPIDTVSAVLMNSLSGAGDTRRPLLVSVATQWLIGLPLAWLLGPTLGLGLWAMWVAFYVARVVSSVALVGMWQRGRWATVAV